MEKKDNRGILGEIGLDSRQHDCSGFGVRGGVLQRGFGRGALGL